jgi:acetyltransferase-like isoleucine patch superfamily enzyme
LAEKQIATYGWQIGDHTYGAIRVREAGSANLTLGKFTSIGASVSIILGSHRIDAVTTYPFKTLGRFWPNGALVDQDHFTHGDVSIGNDVWIGDHVTILSGVSIGDGSVIGTGAIVTHDVPPYGIAVGTPASVSRYRFRPEIIERLLAIKWWNWSDEQIDEYLPAMFNSTVDDFVALCDSHGW